MAKKHEEKPETDSSAVARILLEVQAYFDYQDADYFMDGALSQLAKAAEIQPDNPKIYYWMGYCYAHGLGNGKEARPLFEKAILMLPDYIEAHLELAYLTQDSKPETTYEIYMHIVSIAPACLEAWHGIISRLKYNKQLDEAIAKADEMLRYNHNNARAYLIAGEARIAAYMFEKSDDVAALPFYDKAVELAPQDPEYYYQRYFILMRLGKYEDALQDLLMQQKLGSNVIITYYFVDAYTALRRFEEALEVVNDWIKTNASEEAPYRKRAEVYKAMGEYDLALKDMNTAIKKIPKYEIGIKASLQAIKAEIWRLKGNYNQALLCVEKAINGATYSGNRLHFLIDKANILATTDPETALSILAKAEIDHAHELELYSICKQRITEIRAGLKK